MATREYTPDMGEISGFGGGYEDACRKMVLAGLAWFDAEEAKHAAGERADAPDPKFRGFQGVYGIITDENDDAKALSQAVVDATGGDCTGAMHQASISHVFAVRRLGWNEYARQMRERED